MSDIETIAAKHIAADWTPDRYYRDLDLVAFAAELRASAWQPIETAPRDNVGRLVWDPETRSSYCVSWVKDFEDEPGRWEVFGGAYVVANPTHWQPIPEPPEAA